MSEVADESRYGTVHELPDGRVQVRFERLLPYSVETVWAALTATVSVCAGYIWMVSGPISSMSSVSANRGRSLRF